uniref:uncharacterized protein LOC107000659 isoform X1 n=2 Tax=Macaca mulatta TaxID=9544 RepID=UPI0010A2A34E|nr:uncharacterized protein LOC107000659 isoform X1 [Macaca mulatta]XP_028683564.1 uncharacterized protein LOC107000659 isoform X1 [Macaca mulatta]XP_028683565.1 uncharacterized protein LOC107000659 isoform X1 [Macaca mulatta]XP_028683566.1 uncharacterized protein LOC107000659 isoform X1 [Macaca mulatta]
MDLKLEPRFLDSQAMASQGIMTLKGELPLRPKGGRNARARSSAHPAPPSGVGVSRHLLRGSRTSQGAAHQAGSAPWDSSRGLAEVPGVCMHTCCTHTGLGAETAGLKLRAFHRKHSRPSEPSAAAMSSSASASALQHLVEQLKLEAGMERIKVPQAAAELQQYCMQNACKDALLVGVPAGSNPFREPRSCALL